MICIEWHFVPVFNDDLYTAVHIFPSLSLASLLNGCDCADIHIDFNVKYDQLSVV